MANTSRTTPQTNALDRLWLLAALVVLLLLWWWLPQPFIASDPWEYARRGHALWQDGSLGEGGIFDQRLTLIATTSTAYALWGVGMHSTNAAAILAALLVIAVVWAALPGGRARRLGLLLALTSIPLLKQATMLYPDLPGAALMAACFWALTKRNADLSANTLRLLLAPAAALLFFAAMLAKETAIWLLPVWGVLLLLDARDAEGRNTVLHFHVPALIIGLALGAGYLLFSHITWGDPLARLKAIEAMRGDHLWSWDGGWPALRYRLTTGPARLLLGQYGAPLWVLALLGAWTAPRHLRPWAWYALAMLVFFWLGSTSLQEYQPLPLMERMTMPLLPPLLILAAHAAAQLTLAGAHLPARAGRHAATAVLLAVLAVPFLHHVQQARRTPLHEEEAMALVRAALADAPGEVLLLLCSDERSLAALPIHFGFRPPANLRLLHLSDAAEGLQGADRVLLHLHRDRAGYLQRTYGLQDPTELLERSGLTVVFEQGPVVLFLADAIHERSTLKELSRRMATGLPAED